MNGRWEGKSLILGMPLSFTSYRLENGVLTERSGLVSINESQVQLYRVLDIEMSQDFVDNMLDQGTITLITGNANDFLVLKNIKSPREVKRMLNEEIAKEREKQGIRTSEIIDNNTEISTNRDSARHTVSHADKFR